MTTSLTATAASCYAHLPHRTGRMTRSGEFEWWRYMTVSPRMMCNARLGGGLLGGGRTQTYGFYAHHCRVNYKCLRLSPDLQCFLDQACRFVVRCSRVVHGAHDYYDAHQNHGIQFKAYRSGGQIRLPPRVCACAHPSLSIDNLGPQRRDVGVDQLGVGRCRFLSAIRITKTHCRLVSLRSPVPCAEMPRFDGDKGRGDTATLVILQYYFIQTPSQGTRHNFNRGEVPFPSEWGGACYGNGISPASWVGGAQKDVLSNIKKFNLQVLPL